MKIALDVGCMETSTQAHAYFMDLFHFPAYYGKNLDALFECLCELPKCVTVELPVAIADDDRLGSYGRLILQVFEEAAADNDRLTVKLV